MLFLVITELFVPRGRVRVDEMSFVTQVLDVAGLHYAVDPDRRGRYWVIPDWHEGRPLEEALGHFDEAQDWGVELWQMRLDGGRVDFYLSIDRDERYAPFERIALSADWKHTTSQALLAPEFLSCSLLLAALLKPIYGCGGSNWGLRGRPLPILGEALAQCRPQEVEWLTIFGPPYVEQLGLEHLLSAPVWRRDVLPNGCVALTLAPDHDHVEKADAARLARHLGIIAPSVSRSSG